MSNLIKKLKKATEPKVQLSNVQRLMDIINNRKDNNIKHPYGFPEGAQDTAKYWIDFLEPRVKYEIDTTNSLPYQERLVDCLKIFFKLNSNEQRYLTELRDKDICWRGDSIEFMKKREKVTPEMLADKERLRMMLHSMIAKIGRAT